MTHWYINGVIKFIVIFLLGASYSDGNRVPRSSCSTRDLDIPNGDYSLMSGNTVVYYRCKDGYVIYGAIKLACFGDNWSSAKPKCIRNTCIMPNLTDILHIESEFNGAVLKFSCVVNYRLVGPYMIVCDGRNWSENIPVCEAWNPPTRCDFEDEGICGWLHHDKDDLDWIRHSGATETAQTGPMYDHTLGASGNGHYMYFESSSPTRIGHKAILQSPKYMANLSINKCLNFWYHILGTGDIGTLEVFIKPETENDTSKLQPVFVVGVNKGSEWQEQNVTVTPQCVPFQIFFVATRRGSYRSDFAIDDVQLVDCSGNFNSQTAAACLTSAPPLSSTRAASTTATYTTLITNTSTGMPLSTVPSTIKYTPTLITTPQPEVITTEKVSQTTTQTPAERTTTMDSKTTLHPAATTMNIISKTTQDKSQIQSSQLTTQALFIITNKSAQALFNITKETLAFTVNPGVPSSDPKGHHMHEMNGPSKIGYALIGVGVVVIATAVIGICLVIYRREIQKNEARVSASSINPLYTIISNKNDYDKNDDVFK